MSGKKWILLVSGSKGWENYKHQANVCLHYQLIKRHGIPDEQIVVMMYDDIAHNPNNSKCNGKIPSIIDGQDVYSGVPKDYTGADVTQNNFLSALRGVERKDKKKVIASGPNDNIYIYMTGLGQDSGFQFPEKALNAKAFTDVLKSMHAGKKFSKMVIFMDSDFSGLMFEGLPRSIDIFALASCHKYVQNTPTNYDKEREVFASDLFSKTWLTYLNGVNFAKDTFKDLVEDKQPSFKEDEACPNRFGDEKIIKCHLSEFLQKH